MMEVAHSSIYVEMWAYLTELGVFPPVDSPSGHYRGPLMENGGGADEYGMTYLHHLGVPFEDAVLVWRTFYDARVARTLGNGNPARRNGSPHA